MNLPGADVARRVLLITAAVMVPPVIKGFGFVAGIGLACGGFVVAERVRASLVREALKRG